MITVLQPLRGHPRAARDVHFGGEPQFLFTDVVQPTEILASAKMVRILVPKPFQVAIHKGRGPSGILEIFVPTYEDLITTPQLVLRQTLVALFLRVEVTETFSAVRLVLTDRERALWNVQ